MDTAIVRAWLTQLIIAAVEAMVIFTATTIALYWLFTGAASLIRSAAQL